MKLLAFLVGVIIPSRMIYAQSVDIKCIMEHCAVQQAECELDKHCREALSCINGCMDDVYPNDNSWDKIATQNCTSYCTATYEDDTFEKYLTCINEYECVSFPPINGSCAAVTPMDGFDVTLLEQMQWFVAGYNPVYDCFACQSFFFEAVNATTYWYKTNYSIPDLNGNFKPSYTAALVNNQPNTPIVEFAYYYDGLVHQEKWTFLGQDPSSEEQWSLFYYCGTTNTWFYEGGLVASVSKTLSNDANQKITQILANNNLDYSQWCLVDNTCSFL